MLSEVEILKQKPERHLRSVYLHCQVEFLSKVSGFASGTFH